MFFQPRAEDTATLFKNVPSDPPTDAELDAAIAVPDGTLMEGTSADTTKTWIQVSTPELALKSGWVRADRIEPAEGPGLETLDPFSFVKNCTLAARVYNAAAADDVYGINRDFMIAYALVQTGTGADPIPRNISQDFSPEPLIGPFALTATQWNAFVASPANVDGYIADDIRTPVFQCYGFAEMVGEATRALSTKFTIDGPKSSGPYVPNSVELFLYLAMGNRAASTFIAGMRQNAGQAAIALLRAQPGVLPDSILSRYRRFLGADGEARILSDVVKKIADEFDAALNRSFTLVRDLTPEDVIYFVSGTLPWMVRAREELTKGVKETGTPPNPEILKYFKATGHQTEKEDAWCGAFVAWCLVNSGSDLAAKSVKAATAATAASWKTWGDVEVSIGTDEKDAIPIGAVVVLRPSDPSSDTTGHVAFFVDQTADSISLLGGNQSNSVKISSYPRSEIVAIRMLKGFDAAPTVAGGPGVSDPNFEYGTLGPFTRDDWAKYTNVLGRRESSNRYGGINQFNFIGRWQFGADALVDGGYVRSGATNRVLVSPAWWLGKLGVGSQADWLANKASCQDIEMVAYTKRHYRSLLNIKVTRAVTENATKAQLAGLLATAHLLGPGGVCKMLIGQDGADANGVTGREYFKLLSLAFGGGPNPPRA